MKKLWIALCAIGLAVPAFSVPQLNDDKEVGQKKPPRMIIIRVKREGQGKDAKDVEAQVLEVSDIKQRVTDEASARQALEAADTTSAFQLTGQSEDAPQAVKDLFSVASMFASDSLEQGAAKGNFHHWHHGHAYPGSYFYGYGSYPYYGYTTYYPYYYPSYGYYYGSYYYPYTYSYYYPSSGYGYYYYYNPYYYWL